MAIRALATSARANAMTVITVTPGQTTKGESGHLATTKAIARTMSMATVTARKYSK